MNRHLERLPPSREGIPQTLTVLYCQGGQVKMPYFDKEAAEKFLEGQVGVSNYFVTEYTGE